MYRVLSCLTIEHDWELVLLAGALCFFASLTAINLFYRARATSGRARAAWIVTAGIATGCGIWATHFVAMLAYEPGVTVAYDVTLTVASLLAAIAVTSLGLGVAAAGAERWRAPVGGGIVGGGIACMHYTGMWALELPGYATWSPDLVAFSIAFGIVFGAAALAVTMYFGRLRATLAAAVLLTLAIVSHHFTAMGAVEIVADPTRVIGAMSLAPDMLALSIAAVAALMLALSLVGTIVDERFHNQRTRLDAALQNMRQGLLMFDEHGRLVLFNQRFIEMYKLAPGAIRRGNTLCDILQKRKEVGTFSGDPALYSAKLVAEDGHFTGDPDLKSFANEGVEHKTLRLADGRTIAVTNQTMAGGGWVSTHTDITETTQAAAELERTKVFLDTVVDSVPATLAVKDARDFRYVLMNRSGEKFFGLRREDVLGKTAHEVFPKEMADSIVEHDQEVLHSREKLLIENRPIETPGGEIRLVTTSRLAIRDSQGDPQYLLAVVEDVTERRRAEERIEHMARHDPLTDLPNRTAFNETLKATLAEAEKTGGSFAVLCIDLDRFKEVNDVFGHAVGDALLKDLATRLKFAAGDAFLARLGGDEFTLILKDQELPAGAVALAESLMVQVADDFEIDGNRLRVGMSIGVAMYPTDSDSATTLIANADAALYRAKAQGRGTFCFFEAGMDQRLRERRAMQHELRTAVSRNELVLHYQPQAQVGGEIVGFEALVRWEHPTHGRISPATFIPIAEESGLILSMGEWILREACREAASWQKPLGIAVNLSPIQFRHGDLASMVHQVLLDTGLQPNRLELEITEGVLIGDFSRALSILRRLKALGVRIAMDDFGTGYSSLSYLQSFPFDKIKIDRAFISNVDTNPQSAAIVRAVIGLGRGLDLPVMAEGVETDGQLEFLSREACTEVQGFLVGRPMSIGSYDEIVGREPTASPEDIAAQFRMAG
jgi:diguanylate cyclase (GGDEF)-like protein/PAS domain S-box-containing protein